MLDKILIYLRSQNRVSGRGNLAESRELLTVLNTEASDLTSNSSTASEFANFLRKTHDLLVSSDTTIKSAFLRVIRLSMNTVPHCEALVQEEIHWVVITSLERDVEQVVLERMQALKLIKKFISISPKFFPLSFARSLVSVGNHKDDNIRRVCIETLRELCVVNPEIVAKVNGFSCLLEAVLDPSTHDMGESIVMSILFLMNSSTTRYIIQILICNITV
jgi:rapamycin-insensitive companion of mTOR